MSTATLDIPELTITTIDERMTPEQLMHSWVYFEGWLEQLDPDFEVGWACLSRLCPIAQFLAEYFGDENVLVGPREFCVRNTWYPMPGWASAFVHQVDTSHYALGAKTLQVTAQKALDALTAVVTTHA